MGEIFGFALEDRLTGLGGKASQGWTGSWAIVHAARSRLACCPEARSNGSGSENRAENIKKEPRMPHLRPLRDPQLKIKHAHNRR